MAPTEQPGAIAATRSWFSCHYLTEKQPESLSERELLFVISNSSRNITLMYDEFPAAILPVEDIYAAASVVYYVFRDVYIERRSPQKR